MPDFFSLSDVLIKQWIAAFKRAPRTTVITTLVVVASIGIGAYVDDRAREARRQVEVSADYRQKLDSLSQVESALADLSGFVRAQKQQVTDTQRALEQLQQQHQQLKPVLDAEHAAAVEGALRLFLAEAERNAAHERWVGFWFGVAASLVATILAGLSTFLYRRLRAKPDPPAA